MFRGRYFGRPLSPRIVFIVFQVQRRRLRSVQRLEHLPFHTPADPKIRFPAVLHLIIGEAIPKPAAFLLFEVQREAQTAAINPPLADLAQSPYSPRVGQGRCDLREAGGVGDGGETVVLLDKIRRFGPACTQPEQATYS